MYCDRRLGGVEHWSLDVPADAYMRIPEITRKCVAFLVVESTEYGVSRDLYCGTAFFIRYQHPSAPDLYSVYLVTAKHSVERARPYGGLRVRLNRKLGGSELVPLPDRWIYPDNDSSDVVMQEFFPDFFFDVTAVSTGMFATEDVIKKQDIGPGSELFLVGLFTRREGVQKNIPIIRTGVIASMPEEPLIDDYGQEFDAYLIEVRSIGGLSGSPVFVYLPPHLETSASEGLVHRKEDRPLCFLLGLIRQHWDIKSTQMATDFEDEIDSKLNMGIAAITPSQAIMELIMSEEPTKRRKAIEKEYRKSHAATLDSGLPEKEERPFTKEDFEAALKKVARKIEPEK